MTDLITALEQLQGRLPDERQVVLAAAAAPMAFLAVHGCSASDYILELKKARGAIQEAIASLRAREAEKEEVA